MPRSRLTGGRVPRRGWVLPRAGLIGCELAADVLAEEWSLRGSWRMALAGLAADVLASSCWLVAIRWGAGLARGAVLFSVASAVLAIAVGVGVYREPVSRVQAVGLLLGLGAVACLAWGGTPAERRRLTGRRLAGRRVPARTSPGARP